MTHGLPRSLLRAQQKGWIDPPSAPIFEIPTEVTAPHATQNGTGIGSTVNVTTGTWNGSPVSYAYQWKKDGTNVGGALAASYTLVSGDPTHSFTCTVTATNPAGSSTPATSSAVVAA
jgi:hypothetical protein